MRLRRAVAVACATGAMVALPEFAGVAPAGAAVAATVEVKGGDVLSPGHFIKNNFRFVPRNIAVSKGDRVRWVDHDRDADDPHTVTIANKADLPQTIAQLDACYNPNGICTKTLAAHDPGNDEQPPFNFVVNKGGPGLDTRGDSLLFGGPFDQSVAGKVTAAKGTTLYYLCVIHPWMQGSIQVT
jgi:plastocyanin